MVGRMEFLFAILIPLLLEGAAIYICRAMNRGSLPPGSYLIESLPDSPDERAPGTAWSRYGGLIGHWIGDLSIYTLVIVYLIGFLNPSTDLYGYISPLVIDMPMWVNWVGIVGIWLLDALNATVLIYNVNFTPCTQPMKTRYVLATGGPYRYVRHPVYLSESLGTIFAFLATGIWMNCLGVVSWLALLHQPRAEEDMQERRFGRVYSDYKARTGRFFPKLNRG